MSDTKPWWQLAATFKLRDKPVTELTNAELDALYYAERREYNAISQDDTYGTAARLRYFYNLRIDPINRERRKRGMFDE